MRKRECGRELGVAESRQTRANRKEKGMTVRLRVTNRDESDWVCSKAIRGRERVTEERGFARGKEKVENRSGDSSYARGDGWRIEGGQRLGMEEGFCFWKEKYLGRGEKKRCALNFLNF